MTLRLILTRHAKSAWGAPGLDDHDRPLNGRGAASADAVGSWLAARGHVPALALVSSAERTRQTWARIAAAFDEAPGAVFSPALYLAGPDALMGALRKAGGDAGGGPVMMIAHNPGIASFARGLVSALPDDTRFAQFPTAATAVIDFDAPGWGTVDWGTGRIADLAFARDLIAGEG